MYQVKTEAFSGPLEKLLELIEEKKMDITQISLAEVTADFLLYIETIKETAYQENQDSNKKNEILRILADFLIVASHLVLIKSKALLPNLSLSEEEEEGIYDLERRLKIYGQLKPMFAIVKKQWQEANPFYSRPLFFLQPAVFYPPSKISPQLIKQALEKLIGSIGSFFLENETIKRQLFTLEEKIAEVTLKITQGFSKFSQIISHKTKEEVIVMFLALLHLLRENIFTAKQEKLFDDIQIEKFNNTL